MAQLTFVLAVLSFLIAAIGLIYTFSLGRRQRLQSEYDAPMNGKIQEHPYVRNPMLLAYVIAGVLAAAMIAYFAFGSRW
jgi:Na+-transporting methylmalonyl-CoA/oxaloacetate decarboxylase gamma subunit